MNYLYNLCVHTKKYFQKMIQANELRIGNWVLFDVWGDGVEMKWIKISGINQYGIEFEGCPNFTVAGIGYDKLLPIPISSDILKKCEFEFPSNTLTLNDDWFLYDNYDGFWLQVEKQGESGYICERFKIECKYLHQLQNLIYSLTNSEIKINL